jgi:hypothetical protein
MKRECLLSAAFPLSLLSPKHSRRFVGLPESETHLEMLERQECTLWLAFCLSKVYRLTGNSQSDPMKSVCTVELSYIRVKDGPIH